MPLVATEPAASSRSRVIRAFLVQGFLGLLLIVWLTLRRSGEVATVLADLGNGGGLLVLIFVAFSLTLAFLKFPLTDQIFVSLAITAYIAMFPLLGLVLSAWIGVFAAIVNRGFDMAGIGPTKVEMIDPPLEWVKTFGLFGTYGIPIVLATLGYEWLGGVIPVRDVSPMSAVRIAFCGLILILSNNLIMTRVQRAYGYSLQTCGKLVLVDSGIYTLTLPYAVLMAFSFHLLGWWGVLASAFTGVVVNWVGRNLALARAANEQLVRRLSSLTNIGKTISLDFTTEQLLRSIYTECSKVVDVSLFSIALFDETKNELHFQIKIREGMVLPRTVIPVGEGLNSWVVLHGKPLRVASNRDERERGLQSLDDGWPTESWLGVPMIVRDHLIGVIAVQSFRRNAFTEDDQILLTAVANQAAVALKNAHLYQDLEGLNSALEQRVLERTNELREANLRLISADRSKNQFLANMSHELRTPLNSIIGFSSVLLERSRDLLPIRLYRFVENIHASGTHLLLVINDILDLSKIEAGRLDLEIGEFDIRDTLTAVERVIKGMASEAGVRLLMTIDENVPRVRLDEGRVKQVLLNLLSNAVKFSPSQSSVRLRVSFLPDESPLGQPSLSIEVVDEGIGIAPEEIPRIFDQFYQVSDPRRSRKGGTGLGLALTRSFIELHHGRIEVRSSVGVGSAFTIHIPVDPVATRIARASVGAAPATAKASATAPSRPAQS